MLGNFRLFRPRVLPTPNLKWISLTQMDFNLCNLTFLASNGSFFGSSMLDPYQSPAGLKAPRMKAKLDSIIAQITTLIASIETKYNGGVVGRFLRKVMPSLSMVTFENSLHTQKNMSRLTGWATLYKSMGHEVWRGVEEGVPICKAYVTSSTYDFFTIILC